ncbi:MFS transporter [Liquorilactobacillus capillatus]|uniref:Transporter, major facilitator family protein n=1 Tax=Liquorilactobacillus capillatus DSM 19910 TaxID=1423731 RepID=A0A0R1MBP9_9LACO|nr:MFS transporter [Liquorilactobacillus capillatus]KRL01507.1 transporter, major facilitator family protein [Liquorilactobacillus capillatus DSM 19910]
MDKKQKIIILLTTIGIFLCMLDTTIMNIALPKIQTGLDVGLENLSWALNIYTIIFAVFTIPCARIADLIGRNKIYLIGLIAFMLGSFFSGSAHNIIELICARGIQSLGAAIVFPASMTIGISAVGLKSRKTVLTILGITQGLASALGPTIGGIITQYLGWRFIFFINLPLTIAAIFLALNYLPLKNEDTIHAKIDFTGMLLSMLMLFSLTFILIKGNDLGWSSSSILSLATLAFFTFILFLIVESRSQAPMIPLTLFKNRQFIGAVLAMILSGIFLVAVMVIMPTFFTTVLGKSELAAAFMITPAPAAIFLLSPISGRLVDITGPRLIMLLGFLLILAGYLILSFSDPAHYYQLLISFILIGGGFGIIAGPIVVLGAASFTGELLTASQSVLGLFRQIGTLLAVAIFVSALTANLQAAKSHSLKSATARIERTALPKPLKKAFQKTTKKVLASDGKLSAQEQQAAIKQRTKNITQAKYTATLAHIPDSSQLSRQTRQEMYATIATKVQRTILHQETIMLHTTKKIKKEVKTNLKQAFLAPYQKALPFVLLATFASLLFYRKKDYQH